MLRLQKEKFRPKNFDKAKQARGKGP